VEWFFGGHPGALKPLYGGKPCGKNQLTHEESYWVIVDKCPPLPHKAFGAISNKVGISSTSFCNFQSAYILLDCVDFSFSS
jgi:hypothetical protein